MRTSVVIASHNEGDLLWRTVGSCLETTRELDCEIVVADDASTDGCVEEMQKRFPDVRLVRFSQRRGVSPTKDLAARSSRGEVLIFLDAHCKPQPGAISRLVNDIEQSGERSVFSPLVVALDPSRWECKLDHAGYSYWVDLKSFENGWHHRDELKRVSGPGGRRFYEQACVVGCSMAMARSVYDRLRGFDIGMRSYGSEDLDFGLRAWQMGYTLLCDPGAVVGHRFRDSLAGYSAPLEHCLLNELRMARKNLGDRSWSDWVKRHQKRSDAGVWSAAWELFEQDRRSVELERDFLLANRVRDEYQYARRFGLPWPSSPQPAAAAAPPPLRVSSTRAVRAEKADDLELARINRPTSKDLGPTKQPPPKPTKRPPSRQPTKMPPPREPTKPPPPCEPTKLPPCEPTKPPPPREPTKRPPWEPTKRPPRREPTKRPPSRQPTKMPPQR